MYSQTSVAVVPTFTCERYFSFRSVLGISKQISASHLIVLLQAFKRVSVNFELFCCSSMHGMRTSTFNARYGSENASAEDGRNISDRSHGHESSTPRFNDTASSEPSCTIDNRVVSVNSCVRQTRGVRFISRSSESQNVLGTLSH